MNGVDFLAGAFGRGVDKIANIVGKWGSSQPVDDSKSGIKMDGKTYQVVVSLNGCYWYLDEEGKKHAVASIPATTEWEWVNIAEKVIKDFKTCYRTPGGKVEVWSWYLLNDEMEVLKETHRITDSTDMDNRTGKVLESIPEEWVMIDCDLPDMTERDVTFIKRCYRTPDGKVEIEGLEAIDDKLSIRESIYNVIQSTDGNFPAGYTFRLIPENWARMVCDFPDMTERDVTFVKRCYRTPDGKVEIEGLEAIDNRLSIRESIYKVLQSTDTNFPAGDTFRLIPDNWTEMVCDFPDMTERDVIYVLECYTTEGGKVQVEGLLAVDNVLGSREEIYTVLQSTDPGIDPGRTFGAIPERWARMVCDFPDLTDVEIIEVDECYRTAGGKVQIKGYQSVDVHLGMRDQYYYIVNTTDDTYPKWSRIDRIPNEWVKTECDFPNLTERSVVPVDECYTTAGGKIHIEGYRSVDGVIGVRTEYLIVMETSDPSIERGTMFDGIQEGWERVTCDFADLTERHIIKVDECYTTAGGKIHLGGYRSVDGIIGVRNEYLIVTETSDPGIERGATFSKVQEGWERVICDFPDATTADTEIVENCYKTAKGKVQLRTYLTMDGYGKVREFHHLILKTTDPDYNIGSILENIPSGWLSIECDFASSTERHLKQVKDCYTSSTGNIYVEGEVIYNNSLEAEKMQLVVVESTDPDVIVGTELTRIPEGYTKIKCRCNCGTN